MSLYDVTDVIKLTYSAYFTSIELICQGTLLYIFTLVSHVLKYIERDDLAGDVKKKINSPMTSYDNGVIWRLLDRVVCFNIVTSVLSPRKTNENMTMFFFIIH